MRPLQGHSFKIKYPWDVPDATWEWSVLAITRRSFPIEVWTKPKSSFTIKHIDFLVNQLQRKRNFVACFCKHPTYMKDLYFYVAATWICTQSLAAEIISVEEIRESARYFDMDRRDTFEKTDLLILPYTDLDNINLKYTREPLGRIFQLRRVAKKATLIDIQTNKGDGIPGGGLKAMHDRMSQLYGKQVSASFASENSKYVIVKPEG